MRSTRRPWPTPLGELAWGARTMVSNFTGGSVEDRIRSAELAIGAAEHRNDPIAAVNTLMMHGIALAPADPVTALESSLEALRRARQCGHQSVIISAIVTAGAVYMIRGTDEDFASALALFESALDMQHDTTNTLWLNLNWAHLLVRARQPGPVSRLARAIHLADRLRSPHAEHAALRLLALCVARRVCRLRRRRSPGTAMAPSPSTAWCSWTKSSSDSTRCCVVTPGARPTRRRVLRPRAARSWPSSATSPR